MTIKIELPHLKISTADVAPISKAKRAQLERDSKDLFATAKRKQVTLDRWEEATERAAANEHFELGCWLHHLHNKMELKDRVECAIRIFLAGIQSPRYKFFTVFDFGERQFDSIFEMGDASAVLDALRDALAVDTSGQMAKAFAYFGWEPQKAVKEFALC